MTCQSSHEYNGTITQTHTHGARRARSRFTQTHGGSNETDAVWGAGGWSVTDGAHE